MHALVETTKTGHADVHIAGFDIKKVNNDGRQNDGDTGSRKILGQTKSVQILGNVGDLHGGEPNLLPGHFLEFGIHGRGRHSWEHLRTMEGTRGGEEDHSEQGSVGM